MNNRMRETAYERRAKRIEKHRAILQNSRNFGNLRKRKKIKPITIFTFILIGAMLVIVIFANLQNNYKANFASFASFKSGLAIQPISHAYNKIYFEYTDHIF